MIFAIESNRICTDRQHQIHQALTAHIGSCRMGIRARQQVADISFAERPAIVMNQIQLNPARDLAGDWFIHLYNPVFRNRSDFDIPVSRRIRKGQRERAISDIVELNPAVGICSRSIQHPTV
ncbi:MAG: hypothetical protein ACD_39C00751G0002 [uncultured bacterium]|nr:MAG: hypothetical protein ACD_39C00751G0002 [uncultured bacterium]